MSMACWPYSILINNVWNLRVGLFTVRTDYVLVVYSIGIHQELLVEFFCNSYKTLCNIKLLSVLLTVLVSGCYNILEVRNGDP